MDVMFPGRLDTGVSRRFSRPTTATSSPQADDELWGPRRPGRVGPEYIRYRVNGCDSCDRVVTRDDAVARDGPAGSRRARTVSGLRGGNSAAPGHAAVPTRAQASISNGREPRVTYVDAEGNAIWKQEVPALPRQCVRSRDRLAEGVLAGWRGPGARDGFVAPPALYVVIRTRSTLFVGRIHAERRD